MKEYSQQSDKLPKGATWETVGDYFYYDAGGRLWLRKVRQVAVWSKKPVINVNTGKQRKRFQEFWPGWESKPDHAPKLLYRLPETRKAIADQKTIFIVEGEAKADALRAWGFQATCNEGGAGEWSMAHADELRGADAIILPDNDQIGREHADDIGRSLANITRSSELKSNSSS